MFAAISNETVVNSIVSGDQVASAMAKLSGGGYVVGWRTPDTDGTYGLSVQIYNEYGQRVGTQQQVETSGGGHQYDISLAALGTGFAAVWYDQASNSIRMQAFDADGAQLGGEVVVNTEAYSTQYQPVVTEEPGGGVLVAWSSYNDDSFTHDIRAQRYNADGTANGSEFTVNSTTTGHHYYPDAALLTNGTVVVWSYNDQVWGQRYDAAGAAAGAEFQVNTNDAGGDPRPQVTGLVGGGFVVVWGDNGGGDSSGWAVIGQVFDASGNAVGAEFQINDTEASTQYLPAVSATADGGFFVAWESNTTGGETPNYTYDVVGRQFDATGAATSDEIILNQGSYHQTYRPAVVGLDNGLIAATWDISSFGTEGDGSGYAVMQRLFAPEDSPVVLPESPEIAGFNNTVSFAEADVNAGPQLLDANASVAFSDADNTDFDGGRVIVSYLDLPVSYQYAFSQNEGRALDQLGVRNQGTAPGEIGLSGSDITFGGAVIGTITGDGTGGNDLVISLNASADEEAVEALLENLTFATGSDAPDSPFDLAIQVEDGAGGASEPQVVRVTVTPETDAGVPIGDSDTQVNSYTNSDQTLPDVAALADGGWVTVWRSTGQDRFNEPGYYGVYGQRYDAQGAPVGGEFLVNTATASHQYQANVTGIMAGPNAGGWIVAWQDDGNSGEGYLRAQIFDATGVKVGGEIQVPANVTYHADPAIDIFDDGSFVIAWYGYWPAGGSGYDVMAQRFDASGSKLGGQEQVNVSTTHNQTEVAVASFAGGDYVVTWYDANDSSIKARIIRPDATDSAEIMVNSANSGTQNHPDVAVLSGGGFVVVWEDHSGLDGSGHAIFAQIYADDGTEIDAQFRVNDLTYSTQQQPAVASWGSGFVVTFSSYAEGNNYEIKAQYFDALGNRIDEETLVNASADGHQYAPRIDELANGDVIVTWYDNSGKDGSVDGVYQRVLGDPANYVAESDAPLLAGLRPTVTFDEADVQAGPQVIDSSVSVDDADSADFDGGRLRFERITSSTIEQLFGAPDNDTQDNVSIRNQGTAAGQIGVSGTSVTYGGTVIGTITSDGQGGAALEVSLNGNATPEAVEALASNLTYENPSDDPAASRSYRMFVTDGDGGTSDFSTVTINVTPEADAPQPILGDRQVNTFEYDVQSAPAITELADGGYVILWAGQSQDEDAGSRSGVFGQRYDASGVPVGEEFQVNTQAVNDQYQVDVAGFAAGGFVAVWYDNSQSSGAEIRAQIFDASGAKVGGEIDVATEDYSTQSDPTVTVLADGNFVVAWTSYNNDTFSYDIRAQILDGSGAMVGGEFTLNSTTSGTQQNAQVVALAGGGFAAVWEDTGGNDGNGYGVFGRIFDAAGAPAAAEFQANTASAGNQYEASIAELTTGDFVVAWRDSSGVDGNGEAVLAQRIAGDGTLIGDAFLVNDITSSNQYQPQVIALPGGEFAIAYTSYTGDGSGQGVFLQHYNADFSRKDGSVQVNSLSYSTQYQPDLALLASGDIVAAFASNDDGVAGDGTSGDGNQYGVFHRIMRDGGDYTGAENSPQVLDLDYIVYRAVGNLATPMVLDNAVEVVDPDSADLDGGALRFVLSGPHASADDQLSILVGGPITLVGNDVRHGGTSIGTVDGTNDGANGADLEIALNSGATAARVRDLIERVAYANTAATPSTSAYVSIGVTLSDGDGGRSTPQSILVDFQSSVSQPDFVFTNLDADVAMTEAALNAAPQVIDGGVDFEYNGANGLENGYLVINYQVGENSREAPAAETLSVLNEGTGAGQIGVSGTDITYSGTVIGSINGTSAGQSGRDLQIDFGAAATSEAVDALIEAITYQTTSDSPASEVDLRYRVYDGGGAASSYQYTTINITPEDDGGYMPLGDEKRVNTRVAGEQGYSDIAALTDGGYVVIWQSYAQDSGGNDHGIFGQRYDADGEPVGGEFLVNAVTAGSQTNASVIGLQNGGFAVVWDAADDSVAGRFYDAAGMPGDELTLSGTGGYDRTNPQVALLSNGNVAVTWDQYNADGSYDGVVVRVFGETGSAVTGEIVANTYTDSYQSDPAVAANGSGGFVVLWQSNGQDGASYGIYGQRFAANGDTVGTEFQVNTTTVGSQTQPEVTELADGGFVAVWEDNTIDGSSSAIVQQRFNASGVKVGSEEVVNSFVGGHQSEPDVIATPDGGWVVVWRDDASRPGDNSWSVVYGQAFDAAGDRLDGDFQINERTYYYQWEPAVTVLADGKLAVSYTSGDAPGDDTGYGIAQRLFDLPGGADPQSDDPELSDLPAEVTVDEAAVNAGYVRLDPDGVVSVSDSDSTDFGGGRVMVTREAGYRQIDLFAAPDDTAQDSLTFTSDDVSITGSNVRVNGVTIGTLAEDGQEGAALIVDLNGNATAARVETLLEALSYRNISDDPEDARTYRLTVSDGQGGVGEHLLRVNVTPEAEGIMPLGPESQVNSFTYNTQNVPAVDSLADGGYVVTWTSRYQDTGVSDYGVYAQRYDGAGNPVGPEIAVNSTITGSQSDSVVAGLSDGGFVIVWEGTGPGDSSGIFAQRFDASGTPVGPEFLVNANASGSQWDASVTAFDGGFAVFWTDGNDGNGSGIEGRLFDNSGSGTTSDLQINSAITGHQRYPESTLLANGNIAVVWSGTANGDDDISLSVIDTSGNLVVAEQTVNTTSAGSQVFPHVAGLAGGNMVVVWEDRSGADGNSYGIFAQVLTAAGVPVGSEFLVNDQVSSAQYVNDVVALANGGFLISWDSSNGEDGSGQTVLAQEYDADGHRIDGAFIVNDQTSSTQNNSALATLASGAVAAVWVSETSGDAGDGDSQGVFQRLLGEAGVLPDQDAPLLEGINTTRVLDENTLNLSPQLIDANNSVAVADSDSTDFDGGILRVDIVNAQEVLLQQYNSPDDVSQHRLGLRQAQGITIAGAAVSVNGTEVGTITADGAGAGGFEITLNSAATAEIVELLAENLTYQNLSDDPVPASTLRIRLTDGDGGSAAPVLVNLTINEEVDGNAALLTERQANTTTASNQQDGHMAKIDGGFVMVWESYNQEGGAPNTYGIFGQRFDEDGNKLGGEFQINTIEASNQDAPRVAGTADGGFAVVWEDSSEIKLQRFNADGTANGGEVTVNSYTSSTQYQPDITMLANGDLLVVWTSWNQTVDGGSGYDIIGQVLDGVTGAPVGDDFLINQTVSGTQQYAAAAATSDGGFVVSWNSVDSSSGGIFARRYLTDGTDYSPAVAEFQVNDEEEGNQTDSAVAGLTGGGYVVVFVDNNSRDSNANGVFAQIYDATDNPVGDQFRVNDHTPGGQYEVQVAALSNGGFAVTFRDDNGTDGSQSGVYVQQYDSLGRRIDGAVQVNTETSGQQYQPSIAALDEGGFAVGWTSNTSGDAGDGDNTGQFYQIFVNQSPVVGDVDVSLPEDSTLVLEASLFQDAFDDPEGQPLAAIRIDVPPLQGTLYLDGVAIIGVTEISLAQLEAGLLSLVPDADYNGTDSFVWSGSDGANYSTVSAQTNIVVTPVNDPVGLSVGGDTTVAEGENLGRTLSFADPDIGDTYSVSVDYGDGSPLATFDTTSKSPVLNHSFTTEGTFTVEVTVTDNEGSTEVSSFEVTVENAPPVARRDNLYTDEDTILSDNIFESNGYGADSDPGNDSFAVTAINGAPYTPGDALVLPSGATMTILANGDISYDPTTSAVLQALASGQNYTDSFSYTITDSGGLSSTTTSYVYVSGADDNVIPQDDLFSVSEDGAVSGSVFDDNGNGPDVDPEGDTLTVVEVNGQAVRVGVPVMLAGGGILIIGSDGSFSFSAAGEYDELAEGTTRTLSFDYVVEESGSGLRASADGTITINGVNDAPVAADNTYSVEEDEILTVGTVPAGVLGNDYDPDSGDTLTATLDSDVTNGTLIFNANGTFTYTPDADFNGTDSFTYVVSDGKGGTDTGTVTLNVTPENDAPEAEADSYSVDEDMVLTVALPGEGVLGNDSDLDGDSLTATLLDSTDHGSLSFNADGTFTYTPYANYFGTDSFTYEVSDGKGGTDTATATIVVASINDVPVAVADSYSTDYETMLVIGVSGVLGNDTDVETPLGLTALLKTDVANGTLTLNNDGSFTYTPDDGFSGTDSFTYAAFDGTDESAPVTVALNVAALDNQDPVAVNDSYATDEDTPLTIGVPGVLGNDSDPDGDSLSVTLLGDVSNGTLVLNGDGSFDYTPDADWHGTDVFTYQVSDGNGGADTGTVEINVAAVNDDPVAVDDETYTTDEDVTLTVSVLGGVLANDSDVDGDSLTATLLTDVANGTLVLNADGSFTYTGDADWHGTDSFTYQVSDGNGGTDTATATIEVAPINDDPDATDDNYSTGFETALVIPAPGVLANDSDVDGDSLTAALETGPSNGSVTLNGDGSLTYTPDTGFSGDDSFTYLVSDGNGGTDTATVIVQVDPEPASFSIADISVGEGDGTATFTVVRGGDTSGESQELTVALVDGTATAPEDYDTAIFGTFTFAADETSLTFSTAIVDDALVEGSETFSLVLRDATTAALLASGEATIVDNDSANSPPVAEDDSYSTDEDVALNGAVLSNDSDPDGDSLTVTLLTDVTNGTLALAGDGTFVYAADADFNGSDSFTYQVSDGRGGTDTATVSITVDPVNDSPVLTSGTEFEVVENTTTVATLTGTDIDTDLSALRFSISGGADAALFDIDEETGALSFATAPDFEAPGDADGDNLYEVVVALTDGDLTDSQSLTVEVTDEVEWNEVIGTAGTDTLEGTDGRDIIYFNGGTFDTAFGGGMGDIFVFENAEDGAQQNATILDYDPLLDQIDLLGTSIDQAFSWDGVTYLVMNGTDYDTLTVIGADDIDDIAFV